MKAMLLAATIAKASSMGIEAQSQNGHLGVSAGQMVRVMPQVLDEIRIYPAPGSTTNFAVFRNSYTAGWGFFGRTIPLVSFSLSSGWTATSPVVAWGYLLNNWTVAIDWQMGGCHA